MVNHAEEREDLVEPKPRWRGASHEAAAFAFPVLGLVLVTVAQTTAARWAALVYTVGITAMYATSTRATTAAIGALRFSDASADSTTR